MDGGKGGGEQILGIFEKRLADNVARLGFSKARHWASAVCVPGARRGARGRTPARGAPAGRPGQRSPCQHPTSPQILEPANVRRVVEEADGYQPHLVAPEMGYRRLLQECLALFSKPADTAVEEVHQVLRQAGRGWGGRWVGAGARERDGQAGLRCRTRSCAASQPAHPPLPTPPPFPFYLIQIVAKTLDSPDCASLRQYAHLRAAIARSASSALDRMKEEARGMVLTLVDMERSYLTAEVFKEILAQSGRGGDVGGELVRTLSGRMASRGGVAGSSGVAGAGLGVWRAWAWQFAGEAPVTPPPHPRTPPPPLPPPPPPPARRSRKSPTRGRPPIVTCAASRCTCPPTSRTCAPS